MTVPLPVDWETTAQPVAAKALRTAIADDEVGHAYLLVGPRGVGQRELARTFTAALNCTERADGVPCGTCRTCKRVAREAHSVTVTFEPEGRHHLVKDVRDQWIHTASRTLSEGRRRVIRIVAADRMNDAAQNAFLKALEEPPPSTVWLLEAEDDRLLLDTIVSRCRRLDLTTWTPEQLVAHAGRLGIPQDRRRALARAAMGSPDRLAQLAARVCPECDRIAVVGPDGHVETQCLHHEVTCQACGETFSGPVKVDTRRRTPCGCSVEDFDPAQLVGVTMGLEDARDRHVATVRRLAEEGPGAVSMIAREVLAWAGRTTSGLADTHEREKEQLRETYGVTDDRDLPRGLKKQVEARHKRQQRDAKGQAVDRFLDDLGALMRDLLVVHGGGADDHLINPDHADALRVDAARLPATAAIRALEDIARCREALDEFNGAPELQLERVLTPMAASIFATG